ncbi:hypothetical protein [Moorena producens]|uniref:hypothetical protein n=1 Tax=Moorena producens TaxID=1155739 RepID=UPI001314B8C2|nr:hypothetical protein [Moorena producens]
MQRGLGGNPHQRLYQDGSREYGIKILSIPTRIAINPTGLTHLPPLVPQFWGTLTSLPPRIGGLGGRNQVNRVSPVPERISIREPIWI